MQTPQKCCWGARSGAGGIDHVCCSRDRAEEGAGPDRVLQPKAVEDALARGGAVTTEHTDRFRAKGLGHMVGEQPR